MVSVPWYYRESVTPKVIQKLLLKLRDNGEDFPSNYHLEWENLEVKDPITFARKTLWAACLNKNDHSRLYSFWRRMTDENINICMEEYRKIAVEKEFRNFIFRGSSATFQIC